MSDRMKGKDQMKVKDLILEHIPYLMDSGIDCVIAVDDDTEYGDVTVMHTGGMSYKAWVETNKGQISIHVPVYRDKPDKMSDEAWINAMNDMEVEAAVQVYYDIWNFQSSEPFYYDLYRKFEAEHNERKSKSKHAIGQLRFIMGEGNKVQYFDGNRWVTMNNEVHSSELDSEGKPRVTLKLEEHDTWVEFASNGFSFHYVPDRFKNRQR